MSRCCTMLRTFTKAHPFTDPDRPDVIFLMHAERFVSRTGTHRLPALIGASCTRVRYTLYATTALFRSLLLPLSTATSHLFTTPPRHVSPHSRHVTSRLSTSHVSRHVSAPQVNDVDRFEYSRRSYRGAKDPDNPFASMWLQRTVMRTSSKLPGTATIQCSIVACQLGVDDENIKTIF